MVITYHKMLISIVPLLPIYFIIYKCFKYIFEGISMCTLDKNMLKCLQYPLTQATVIIVLSDTHFITHIYLHVDIRISNLY